MLICCLTILLAQQYANYTVPYHAAYNLRGSRHHIRAVDDEGVDWALEAVVEVGIVEQEALEGLASMIGLEL